jgi:coenzyme F420-reducing hydrogenase delta subunit
MTLLTKRLLEHIGVHPDRLRLEWVSAAEGIRFAQVMNDVARKVKELGPLGRGEGMDEGTLKLKLEAVKNLLPYIKLVERERLRVHPDAEEAYQKFFASDEGDRLVSELILDKLTISQILLLLRGRSLSTGEISKIIGIDPSEVLRHLHSSARQGWVRFDENRRGFVPV